MKIMNSYQIEYLQAWKEGFKQFPGWTEEETAAWAEPLLDNLSVPGMALNEPPLYYLARHIAFHQPYFDELSQRERFDLVRAVQRILAPDNHGRKFEPSYDFDLAKSKLKDLLARTGSQAQD